LIRTSKNTIFKIIQRKLYNIIYIDKFKNYIFNIIIFKKLKSWCLFYLFYLRFIPKLIDLLINNITNI